MANLYKRPNSPYWWLYYWTGLKAVRVSTGIRHQGRSRPCPASAAILRATEERSARAKFGLEAQLEPANIGQFFDEYVRGLSVKDITKRNIEGTLRTFTIWLESTRGITLVSDVSRAVAARFVGDRRESGIAESTLRVQTNTLATAWEEAKRRNHCRFEDNPWSMDFRVKVVEKVPFTAEEIASLFSMPCEKWIHLAMRIGLATGARIGTITVLAWENIDFEARIISFPDSKTGAYVVPMSLELTDYLAKRKGTGPVLGSFEGRAASYPSNRFGEVASERLGRPVSFHLFRHTYVTRLQKAGIAERTAMALANHASAQIHRAYSHTRAGELRDVVDGLKLFPAEAAA